jgi:uncharacterized protein YacL
MNLTIFQVAGTADECASVAAKLEPRQQEGRVLIDTSSIVDGRFAGVIEAGFLEGAAVPSFVAEELQFLADSPDSFKRAKGREGLDALNRLHAAGKLTVVDGDHVRNSRPVDAKLIEMARVSGARILTEDLNLRKVASLHGVRVLSIDELAEALANPIRVGDRFDVKISKLGTQPGQGVCFLDDGTMVVVDRAADKLAQRITIAITNVTRTEGGRLLFAAPVAPPEV